jgi:hypothetical protein
MTLDYNKTLAKLDACKDARRWACITNRSGYHLWRSCERGDWLLWLAAKIGVNRKLVVLTLCDCAETALQLVSESEDRPRKAIETTRAWCYGEATIEDVRTAAYAAAYAAYAAYAAAYAVAYAAYAADAAYADDAAYAAAVAAYAGGADLRRMAAIVRKRIPWRVVKAAWEKFEDPTS